MARIHRGERRQPAAGRAGRRTPPSPQTNEPRRPQTSEPRRPRAEGQRGHAPAYDQRQDEPRRPAPDVAGSAEKARRRQKREHTRITKAEMKRRRLRRRLITGILLFAVVVAGIVLSIALLFKVSAFEFQTAEGESPADTGVYTQEEIVAALGIAEGDNLFSFRAGEVEARLNTAFPLLESIQLRRRLPGTVIVRVQPAVETYCLQSEQGWAVLSAQRKVISLAGEQPQLTVLKGELAAAPQVGTVLQMADADVEQALTDTLAALESHQLLAEVTELDLTNAEEASFVYQGRVRVLLGTQNQLDYKIRFAAYLLLDENGDGLSASDTGVLDASHIRSDGTIQPVFQQGDPNAQSETEPEPTPEPGADSAAASSAAEGGEPTPEPDAAPAA